MKEKFKLIANKFKEFNRDTYGMLITVSWILLVICLVIKLFGGNWFELWWDNEKFIAACNYVENNTILKMIVACSFSILTTIPFICIILKRNKLNIKLTILFSLLIAIKSILNWYISGISYIFDFVTLILLPLIINKFKNLKIVLFGNVLVFIFQLITITLRNLSYGFGNFNMGNTVIEQILYQIDYILMIMLFYFYYFKNKKRKEKE